MGNRGRTEGESDAGLGAGGRQDAAAKPPGGTCRCARWRAVPWVMTMPRRLRCAAVAIAASYAALQVVGRTAGSTAAERRSPFPGDEVVPDPNVVSNHAVTIAAPPEAVWPWLTQMGWHRAGYSTPRWVDLVFFPANWPSLDRLDPGLTRDLATGDTVPDGPPGTAWYVALIPADAIMATGMLRGIKRRAEARPA